MLIGVALFIIHIARTHTHQDAHKQQQPHTHTQHNHRQFRNTHSTTTRRTCDGAAHVKQLVPYFHAQHVLLYRDVQLILSYDERPVNPSLIQRTLVP